MTCHTTITPEPIPGIDDMTAITAHRLADALDLLREYRDLAGDMGLLEPGDDEIHGRAAAAVERAIKILTGGAHG